MRILLTPVNQKSYWQVKYGSFGTDTNNLVQSYLIKHSEIDSYFTDNDESVVRIHSKAEAKAEATW